MRLGWLLFALALPLQACSSDDTAAKDAGPNACVASGGICAANFPFLCAPGYEAVTDSRKTACGKSEGTDSRDVSCCIPESAPPDTGTKDTGASDTGAADASAADASSDSTPADATSDGPAEGG